MIVDREFGKKLVEELKKNKTVVFTNGCFDMFHVGHLRYLNEAEKTKGYV